MSREDVESALEAWHTAERDLSADVGRPHRELVTAVERSRREYQRVAGEHMAERITALKAVEHRRHASLPSTPGYHEAAAEETEIARGIWDDASSMDKDIPRAPK